MTPNNLRELQMNSR